MLANLVFLLLLLPSFLSFNHFGLNRDLRLRCCLFDQRVLDCVNFCDRDLRFNHPHSFLVVVLAICGTERWLSFLVVCRSLDSLSVFFLLHLLVLFEVEFV